MSEATGQPLVLDPAGLDEIEEMEFAGVVFRVRHCSPRKMRELRLRLNLPGTPSGRERLSDEQRDALDDAVLDWVLEGWDEGDVVGPAGDPVTCDLAGKRMVMDCFSSFGELLSVFTARLWAKKQVAARAELGNSTGSSSLDVARTGTAPSVTSVAMGSPVAVSSQSSGGD